MANERQYELVYIVAPTATDADLQEVQGEIKEHLEALGGSVESTDLWGSRKLAYPIGPFTEGIYVVQHINGPGTIISELGRRLRVRDLVLRYLTVRVDEDLRKARVESEKRKLAREISESESTTEMNNNDSPSASIESSESAGEPSTGESKPASPTREGPADAVTVDEKPEVQE